MTNNTGGEDDRYDSNDKKRRAEAKTYDVVPNSPYHNRFLLKLNGGRRQRLRETSGGAEPPEATGSLGSVQQPRPRRHLLSFFRNNHNVGSGNAFVVNQDYNVITVKIKQHLRAVVLLQLLAVKRI